MKPLYYFLLACALALASCSHESAKMSDDTGTVSIVGRCTTCEDGKAHAIGITLVLNQFTWTASEPGSASYIFKTKKGKWNVVSPNLVQVTDGNGHRITEFAGLVPGTARPGDQGTSKSDETGVYFTWQVQ